MWRCQVTCSRSFARVGSDDERSRSLLDLSQIHGDTVPFAIYVLGIAVFAQGTSEFMLSGLIPDMAQDLQVSVPTAGLLTSAFAIGMIIGAPLMAIVSMRWQRRRALLTFLITFMVVHVIGALTDSFGVLLVTRIVGAVANAGFLAVALGAAMSMVPADMKGRATSVLLAE